MASSKRLASGRMALMILDILPTRRSLSPNVSCPAARISFERRLSWRERFHALMSSQKRTITPMTVATPKSISRKAMGLERA